MPTYVYKCQDCGHRFEEVQGFHDDPLQVCPDCGGNVRRVIGNVGVTFKGSGFYRTDSRAGSGKKAASDPAKPAAKDSGASGKSESGSGSSGKSDSGSGSSGKSDTGSSGKSGGSSNT
jgi:putative FmdB family regulatory protein